MAPSSPTDKDVAMRRATYAAVLVAGLLLCLKIAAWVATGSVSLLSSLIDSSLDLIASSLNLFAVHYALRPPDEDHRFGHGKLESLAGLGQAAFITGSAIFLVMEATSRLITPIPIERGWVGIAVMVISIVVTLWLVRFQRSVVKQTSSVAISADSLHYSGDVLINGSVIISLGMSMTLGWTFLDPLFAIAIALFLMWNAWQIFRSALDYLMDRELSDEQREKITALCLGQTRVMGIHELKTRSTGSQEFIQLHLELDDNLPLWDAHMISDRVEAAVQKEFPNAEIIIHQDPIGVVKHEGESL